MTTFSIREKANPATDEQLAAYPELLRELLASRGVVNVQDAEAFLNPSYEKDLHDPFLMRDMEKAVERITGAIARAEKIVIYSDYDSDGIPGAVVMHDFFKKIGYDNVTHYIPHRHEEGFGLNAEAVESIAANGAQLMITVDCGIADVAHVALARKRGVDVIITDHHLPNNGVLPDAVAILDPHLPGETYPFAHLCGAGVAFKLVQALLARGGFSVSMGWEKWLLDMVGLATIADMVPLVGENRTLAHYGLFVLRKSPRPGIRELCRAMRVRQRELSEDDIGFMVAPRINAASRMGESMEAFNLLVADRQEQAAALAKHLNEVNDERKGRVASMVKEIKHRLEAQDDVREVIVMGDPRWRPSLLGLAANTLVEKYHRPVFLWGREGAAQIKGSCRSDGSVDLSALMGSLGEGFFLEYGGHAFSGGFSISMEHLPDLEEALIRALAVSVRGEVTALQLVDRHLSLDEVTWKNFQTIARLAPFGEGNPKPLFLFEQVRLASVRLFGRDKNHLELTFQNSAGQPVIAIGFFMHALAEKLSLEAGKSLDLVASFERSTFKATPELRLRIAHIV